MATLLAIKTSDVIFLIVFLWLLRQIFRSQTQKSKVKTTPVTGPPAPSYIFGWSRKIVETNDPTPNYEAWVKQYGLVFHLKQPLGRKRIVLFDPLAISHFFAREETLYLRPPAARRFIGRILGKGILWSVGDDHRRQRKSLSPGFTPQAIRDITSIFFDSAHKAKTAWEQQMASSSEVDVVIDVQKWMGSISLDVIGIAGFGHDFQSLHGVESPIKVAFDSLSSGGPPKLINLILFLLSSTLPILMSVPTKRRRVFDNMSNALGGIVDRLFERSKQDELESSKSNDRSLLGILVRSEKAEAHSQLTREEVHSQMKTLLFAGYETSSITMTWILLELAKHPEKQTRLREELSRFGSDLTYSQLTGASTAPYLDAVVKETLRLHPPVPESTRTCTKDDVIPLSTPVTTAAGEKVTSVTVAAGTQIQIPIAAINRSEVFWGADGQQWRPERWLEDESELPPLAKELPGYHHLLTFSEGPRMCLGKGFAVTEIKAVISVLVPAFHFASRDGPDTQYDIQRALLPRPKIKGEQGGLLPLRVRALQ